MFLKFVFLLLLNVVLINSSNCTIQVSDRRDTHTIVPLNGYSVYPGSGSFWQYPRAIKVGNFVQLEGLLSGSSVTTIAILPEKFRPSGRRIFSVNQNSANTRVDVLTNGEIRVVYAGSTSWIPLDSISYIVD